MSNIQILDQNSDNYVRLAPTVLYRTPSCYATKSPDSFLEVCWRCPVTKQCGNKQEGERRG